MNHRFAIQGGPFGSADALADHARLIESLGYVEFYTSDHVGVPGSQGRQGGRYIVDPFLPLVVAATAAPSLRVGPLVINNEFHNPALLARAAATTDRLTDGRLILGLGTGYSVAEHDGIGQPIRPPGRRVTRFAESLAVLRSLLNHGSADLDGSEVTVHLDDLGIEPVQAHVPFLIGGHGPRVVALAGRWADIFQFTGMSMAADGSISAQGFAAAALDERARWLTEAAGERSDEIVRSSLVQVTHCGADGPSDAELGERLGIPADNIADCPFVLVGSVEQIFDKIGRLHERFGISHWVVRDPEGFAPVVAGLNSR